MAATRASPPLLAPVLAAVVALAPAPAALAAEAGSSPEERRVLAEISAGALRLDYAEYAPDGTFLDGEEGWIPSLSGTLELRGRRGFFRAAARIAVGEVDYEGHVQSTDPAVNGLPARSVSDALFALVALQVGGFVEPSGRLALVGGFAARRWDRDIHSTLVAPPSGPAVTVSGLSEVYRWYELQAGLRWTVVRTRRSELELEGAVVRTAWGTMEVDFGRRIRLELGPRTGFRGGATFRRSLAGGSLHLALGAHGESYSFGQSPVVLVDPADPMTGIVEPRSETVGVVVEAGVGARF